jgi:hypothetical protein
MLPPGNNFDAYWAEIAAAARPDANPRQELGDVSSAE